MTYFKNLQALEVLEWHLRKWTLLKCSNSNILNLTFNFTNTKWKSTIAFSYCAFFFFFLGTHDWLVCKYVKRQRDEIQNLLVHRLDSKLLFQSTSVFRFFIFWKNTDFFIFHQKSVLSYWLKIWCLNSLLDTLKRPHYALFSIFTKTLTNINKHSMFRSLHLREVHVFVIIC